MKISESFMVNVIQTFSAFNEGQKRPDRNSHLRLCGFEYKGCWLIWPPITPRRQAEAVARRYNELYEGPVHIVYWLGGRNMDGERGYQYWVKPLNTQKPTE